MKMNLTKNIFIGILGGVVASTPILFSSSYINNSICVSAPKTDVVNDEEKGISLSNYELEGWAGSEANIQVFKGSQAISENVVWSCDSNKFSVSEAQLGNIYKVNFVGQYNPSNPESNVSKIHATYTDVNGNKHKASCTVRLVHNYKAAIDGPTNKFIKKSATTEAERKVSFELRVGGGELSKPGDFRVETSSYAYELVDVGIIWSTTSNLVTVTAALKDTIPPIERAQVTLTVYHSADETSKEHGTKLTVFVSDDKLTIDQSNMSARVNDAVTLTPKINDNVATKDQVTWTTSDPSVCTFKQDETTGKVELILHKVTEDPVIVYCHQTGLGELFLNYTYCYVNVTNSQIVLSPGETSHNLSERQFQLSAKLDGQQLACSYITWQTSDSTIAYANSNGVVFMLRPGNVTITAIYKNRNDVEITKDYSFNIVGETLTVKQPQIQALVTDQPAKIVGLIGQTEISPDKLSFRSQNPDIVTVNDNGQLTYIKEGTALVDCFYIGLEHLQEYHAITTVQLAQPELQLSLEYTETYIGTNDRKDHNLPKAYIGGVEIGLDKVVWTSLSEQLIIQDGKFKSSQPGDYKMNCTYQGVTAQQSINVTVHAQDYFVNDLYGQEPTIKQEASSIFKQSTYQLKFWFDNERTDPISIKSCRSTNTNRATVDENGLINFKGHGSCDIIVELNYYHPDGNEEIRTATIHLNIPVWWWGWLLAAGVIALIAAAIVVPIVLSKNKKKKKKNKKQLEEFENDKTFVK